MVPEVEKVIDLAVEMVLCSILAFMIISFANYARTEMNIKMEVDSNYERMTEMRELYEYRKLAEVSCQDIIELITRYDKTYQYKIVSRPSSLQVEYEINGVKRKEVFNSSLFESGHYGVDAKYDIRVGALVAYDSTKGSNYDYIDISDVTGIIDSAGIDHGSDIERDRYGEPDIQFTQNYLINHVFSTADSTAGINCTYTVLLAADSIFNDDIDAVHKNTFIFMMNP